MSIYRCTLENLIRQVLTDAGIEFLSDQDSGEKRNPSGLDFKLLEENVEIEVKRYASDRTGEQMKRAPDIIFVQGSVACAFLAKLLVNYYMGGRRNG